MVIERFRRARQVDEVVVATTRDASDDPVETAALAAGARVVRGSTHDVLSRYGTVLEQFPEADVVARVTADCPFIDPNLIDLVVTTLREAGADFVANRLPPPWRRTYPIGLDVEACTREALLVACRNAKERHQREHVMPYLYENSDRFETIVLDLPEDLSNFRWTVDTPEDLDAARELAKLAGPEPFGWKRILRIAKDNPWIGYLNANTVHKSVDQIDERWKPDESNG